MDDDFIQSIPRLKSFLYSIPTSYNIEGENIFMTESLISIRLSVAEVSQNMSRTTLPILPCYKDKGDSDRTTASGVRVSAVQSTDRQTKRESGD